MDGAGRPVVSGPGRRSELGLRVLSGLVLAALALGATVAGGVPFALLWFAAAAAIASEWLGMSGARPHLPLLAAVSLGLAALVVAALMGWAGSAVAALMLASAGLCFAVAPDGRTRAWALAGIGYAVAVAYVPVMLRGQPGIGLALVLWIFAVVWTTDIAAYFTGRRFGGPKLWPSVSPKKTWSGFAGGLAAATLAGPLVVHMVLADAVAGPFGAAGVAMCSAVASVASQGGDLLESAMKRQFSAKDSGRLIPGHGGVMDRLDGFAAVLVLVGSAFGAARAAGWGP